ncbi:MAG: WecB/TagA/CpsF family glycosyltransferase [Candidatus Komeilibacteria bacterium]
MDILGIHVDNIAQKNVLEKIRHYLSGREQHYITTTGPEFIMAAQYDSEFKTIVNKSDLSLADGFGLALAARRIGEKLIERIPGVDLMVDICAIAAEANQSVFLLGASHGVAEQTAVRLIERFPRLTIAGAESGYRGWHRKLDDAKLVEIINRRRPDILFVAFGQVKQEKWIYHNLPKMPSVKLAMGVGGSFDYISGKIKRAPRWMRKLGLEWLYRLCREPWRLPRILTAVIRFSWAILKSKKGVV